MSSSCHYTQRRVIKLNLPFSFYITSTTDFLFFIFPKLIKLLNIVSFISRLVFYSRCIYYYLPDWCYKFSFYETKNCLPTSRWNIYYFLQRCKSLVFSRVQLEILSEQSDKQIIFQVKTWIQFSSRELLLLLYCP